MEKVFLFLEAAVQFNANERCQSATDKSLLILVVHIFSMTLTLLGNFWLLAEAEFCFEINDFVVFTI